MKKIIVILLSIFMAISSLFSCLEKDKSSETDADSTATAEIVSTPTAGDTKATATPAPTPKKTADPSKYFTAIEGYYVNETRKSLYADVEYVNVFGTKSYYTTPDTETYLPLDGNAADWEVTSDKYRLVKTLTNVDGMLILKTVKAVPVYSVVDSNKITDIKSGTGYLYLTNKSTGDIVKVYVNMPVEQTKDRKQTNKKLKYYLYFEKGSYSNFVEETCCLTCYTVDKDGYYTVPYFTVTSACGATIDKTPVGIHTLGTREEWHSWGGSAYGQFATNYASGVYLHSPTTEDGKTQYSVGTGSYNAVGSHASGGCLRMQTGSAYWFYMNCPSGTKLEIVANNPRGTRIERPAKLFGSATYDPTDPILLAGPVISPKPTPTPNVKVDGVPAKYYQAINYGNVDFNENTEGASVNDPSITYNENKLRGDWTASRGLPNAINNGIWRNVGKGNIAVKLIGNEYITSDRLLGQYGNATYVSIDLKCEQLGSLCGFMLDMASDYEGYDAATKTIKTVGGYMLTNCYGFTLTDKNTMRIYVRKGGTSTYYDFPMGIDASTDFHTYRVFRFEKEKQAYFTVDDKLIGYVDFGAGTGKTGIYSASKTLISKTDVVWNEGAVMFASLGDDQIVYFDNIGSFTTV